MYKPHPQASTLTVVFQLPAQLRERLSDLLRARCTSPTDTETACWVGLSTLVLLKLGSFNRDFQSWKVKFLHEVEAAR